MRLLDSGPDAGEGDDDDDDEEPEHMYVEVIDKDGRMFAGDLPEVEE